MKLDILAFGAHPDDVELSASGTLLIEKQQGKKTGIVDLTLGQLGTRGTVEIRKQEAAASAKVLALDVRENLEMEDGFFEYNETNIKKIITVLRKYQPEIVLCNAPDDRHPDHGKGSKIVADACFLSGLRKIETMNNNQVQQAWRPKQVFHYIQDRLLDYDLVVDISSAMPKKLESIKCFATQFNSTDTIEPQTYISKPSFLNGVSDRAAQLGKTIGVDYGEAFMSAKKIGVSSLFHLVLRDT
jgi:N-acetylglucosamine malate deacetylase 1